VLLPSDVFDQPQPVGNKKIEFHISTDMPSAFKKDLEKEQNREEQNYDLPAPGGDAPNVGFGKIFPKPNLNITEEIKEDCDEMPSECISRMEAVVDKAAPGSKRPVLREGASWNHFVTPSTFVPRCPE